MKTTIAVVKRVILTLTFLGIAATFMGCHTAHGFGQDVSGAGREIQEHTP